MMIGGKIEHRGKSRSSADRIGARLGQSVRGIRRTPNSFERGVSSVEAMLMLPFLLLLLMAVVDFGQLAHMAIEVSNAARAGAQYGYQNSATQMDTSGMIAAAENDATDVTTWSANVASSGCMCSDGSNQSQIASSTSGGTSLCTIPPSSCALNGTHLVSYVQVHTQAIYTPLFSWPGAPSSITLNGNAMYWGAP